MFEAMAVVVAVRSFANWLKGSDVFIFVDNTQAQGVLTNGFGPDEDINSVAAALWELAATFDLGVWFERVDTAANWADGPSRPENPSKSMYLNALSPMRVDASIPHLPFFDSR